jgi:hypothetical protein
MSTYQSDSDAVWVGIFAGAIGHHLTHPDDDKTLHQTYRDFLKSPLGADAALRRVLPPLPPRGRVTPPSPARPRALFGSKR